MTSDQAAEDRMAVIRLDDIVPYWRNPRDITDEAINAVATSIERFGYSQPIVIDASNVIIIGHTRYAAMRRMGVTECEVRVAASLPPAKVKQLRVLDNRLHEYTLWDFDQLVSELDGLDATLMRAYFPEAVASPDPGPDLGDPALTGSPDAGGTEAQSDQVDFLCPSCFHEWRATVTREAVLSGRIEVPA